MIPAWFHELSIAYVSLGVVCALIIAVDVVRHPQQMWIMDIVWPVTALFGTAWVLWQYFSYGRLATHGIRGTGGRRRIRLARAVPR